MCTVSAEKGIAAELAQRQKQIEKRLEGLRFESDEVRICLIEWEFEKGLQRKNPEDVVMQLLCLCNLRYYRDRVNYGKLHAR